MEIFWESEIIQREPFFPLEKNGKIPLHLFETPAEVLKIENSELTTVFEEGIDYRINSDCSMIELPPGSKITPIAMESLIQPLNAPNSIGTTQDGKCGLLFSENGMFHQRQLLISYTSRSSQSMDKLKATVEKNRHLVKDTLPKLKKILENPVERPLNVLLFGDSISATCNCSKMHNFPPYQGGFGELLCTDLTEQYHQPITFSNLSEGGQNANWGEKILPAHLAKHNLSSFDLVLLGWGMNDSSGRRSPRKFRKNLEAQIKYFLSLNPDTEFIIISSSLPNNLWKAAHPEYLFKYIPEMIKLKDKYAPHVMVANVTAVWEELLKTKSYYDLTGNGVNHPNDFGHQLYAQLLYSLISDF